NEPIADAVRGILDGHIVLDRKIASHGMFPAINVLNSVSRVMKDITPEPHQLAAENMKRLVSVYQEAEDLINIGAYKRGTNKEIDQAIQFKPLVDQFMKQKVE